LAACQAARAAGLPEDVERILSGEPDLAEEVRARLAGSPAPAPPEGCVTLTLAPPSPDGETLTAPGARGPYSPPSAGDFGDYELLGEVARGGMGVVFRAREKGLNRVVALKMILAGQLATPDEVRRFRQEAEEAGCLDHPHIVPIYRTGEHGGQHYFTMKLVEGGTLGERVDDYRGDPRAAARLVAQVAGAVHYAHQRGILHRDLKPGNILVDARGEPHVTDFGLAKHLGAGADDTRSGVIAGTPGFMSPEQAAGRRGLTVAADVYGLGALLHFLLAGKAPFQAASPMDTLTKVLHEEPVPLRRLNPKVDRDLETICLRCLEKDPRRRYDSAAALAADLGRWLAGEPIRARPAGALERAAKWVRRRPAAAALAGVLAAAALLLAGGGWAVSARLDAALGQAREARGEAELARQEAEGRADELRRAQVSLQAALGQAEDQRRKAEGRAEDLRREREAAVRRAEAANDFLIHVNDRLANLKAEQPIRMELLEDGLRMSEKFAGEGGEDATPRRHTAQLYRCLGDLLQETSDGAKAERMYARALGLLEKLAADHPAEAAYRGDLALTLAQQARALSAADDPRRAEAALARAVGLQDRLAQEEPADVGHRARAAEFRFWLGNLLDERGEAGKAEAPYREALARQEQLVQASPTPAAHRQRAETAAALGWLLADSRPDEAGKLLRQSLDSLRQARRLEPSDRRAAQSLLEGYMELAGFLRRRGLHADLPPLADDLRRDFPDDAGQTYNAACILGEAVRAARAAPGLGEAERGRLADGHAAAAVRMLDRAVKEGYSDLVLIEADNDLDPLRDREDFRRLVDDLRRRSTSPAAPERELFQVRRLADGARQAYAAAKARARTKAQRARAEARRPDLAAFGEKFLRLAERHQGSAAAADALVWVLANCDAAAAGAGAADLRRRAVELLRQDHLSRPEFAQVCVRFYQAPVPEAEELLRAALDGHSQREVRGLAGLALAMSLARRAEKARLFSPSQAADLSRQAEAEFERLAREYGSVTYQGATLGEVARYQLAEVKQLSVGCPAQEVEGPDLDGKPLRLSDFRGKVVVLDFWANWCGFCRQMYPQEQALVRRLEGRPFALLGVNCDDDREAVREVARRQGLNWRSWFDGGSDRGGIARAWHVSGYPSVWVLDHKGVIRHRFDGAPGPKLDQAVMQLVQEAEREQAKKETDPK
jgi:thiol-disulfide isomerase/thioredoxin